jgi:2-succinyl-5-enolpyruvyl-6-hydroxy-3-cyclohexene-1-carboxylate synthase
MKIIFEKIFFCTGARNHDLLKVFGPQDIYFEHDERVAGFKALGLSKVSQKPVAVCTTSGTAVSECVSSMLEAYYSELPLILITGDRPKKLHGTGSPQTILHEELTRSCRRSFFEISLSELSDLDLRDAAFPVHINVLVDDTIPHQKETLFHRDVSTLGVFLKKYHRPLFLFSHENKSMRPMIEKFSQLKLPFYAETLSGGRDLSSFKTEKKLVELFQNDYFDCVVRIGHTPLSKVWRLLERKHLPVFHLDSRNLPALSYGEVLPLGLSDLMDNNVFWSTLRNVPTFSVEDDTHGVLSQLIEKYPGSEISLFRKLNDHISSHEHVYLGNSLVVRFFELTQTKNFKVFGNRGVNGIDGQLSTAIGISLGISDNIYCILGDITTFYDLSSLREVTKNLFLIIVNNNGGRIFDMLNLDKRIILEHQEDFRKISEGLGLSYSNQLEDLGKVQVLELFPDGEQTKKFLQEWAP